jgi:hypothetical protein
VIVFVDALLRAEPEAMSDSASVAGANGHAALRALALTLSCISHGINPISIRLILPKNESSRL